MRCEKLYEFSEEAPPNDQCPNEAVVLADCTPSATNNLGKPGTLHLCADCADALGSDDNWIREFTYLSDGRKFNLRYPTYHGVPVHGSMPRSLIKLVMETPQFQKAADEVLTSIERWGTACIRLEIPESGQFPWKNIVVGYVRSGERVIAFY
jgi:hypothetical protein